MLDHWLNVQVSGVWPRNGVCRFASRLRFSSEGHFLYRCPEHGIYHFSRTAKDFIPGLPPDD